jgi:YVTN family beta-propeller protein
VPDGRVSEHAGAVRRRLRVGLLIAVACVLTIAGIGIWRLAGPDAASHDGVGQNTVISLPGSFFSGPAAVAVTRDGEIWVALADGGMIYELAEPNVGTQGGGMRTFGSPDALVAIPRRAIFYADTGLQVMAITSYAMGNQWTAPGSSGPSALAISPDGKTLYVASKYRDTVRAVSAATGHAGPPIRTGYGNEPVAMAVSPDGRRLYVANLLADSITVIDAAAWRRESAISVTGSPDALAISPDGAWLYVADLSGNSVVVVNTATRRIRSVIRIGRRPVALAITRDGRTLYVANNADNTVTPINTATRTAGTPIPVGREPDALALTSDGRYLYVANFGDNTVSQIQLVATGNR